MQGTKSRNLMCIRDRFKKILPTLMDKIFIEGSERGGGGERGGGVN